MNESPQDRISPRISCGSTRKLGVGSTHAISSLYPKFTPLPHPKPAGGFGGEGTANFFSRPGRKLVKMRKVLRVKNSIFVLYGTTVVRILCSQHVQ